MPKRSLVNEVTDRAKTQQPAPDDPIKARGVGLKVSEWAELETIAQELGITKHAVSTYAVRYFLKHYRAGDIKPETRRTQSLPEL